MTARSLKLFIIVALFSVAVCAVPHGAVHAQQLGTLVPCEGNGCNTCELVTLGNNLLKFIIVLSTLFATIMFVWAGFLFVTASGNQATVKKAKGIFLNVFIGFVIVLTGFLIVDTVMRLLVGDNLLGGGPWSSIDCSRTPNPTPTTPGRWTGSSGETGGVTVGGGGGGGGGTGTTVDPDSQYTEAQARTALQEAGISVNNANPCAAGQTSGCTSLNGINQGTVAQIINIQQACGCQIMVTGGTEGGHAGGGVSHGSGFKVDLAVSPQLDATLKSLSYTGQRSDGAALYSDAAGNQYAREGNHWDITVTAVAPLR